ncbi:cysteine--tRNA ligase [Candidatus Omnitrophota bacterium]
MKIYNSLTRQKDAFEPMQKGRVSMYVCGPTVYDQPHIGHARAAYIFEVIRSYFEYKKLKVKFVQNITDVDDKIIAKAKAEFPELDISAAAPKVAAKYTQSYYADMQALGIRRAEQEPRATEHIEQMKEYISRLLTKGFAYEAGGDVYFDVAKFKDYGRLSNQNLEQIRSHARTEKDQKKKDPLDFALWKKAKPDEPSWPSPWGPGRPGWHIECSVMSSQYLGDVFDIHAGGIDLIFPHHENERAQSCAASGAEFARFWIHNGLLTINGQKMAKSLGNFVTIKDVLKRYPAADILKIFYLHAHYSSPLDFSWQKLSELKKAYQGIDILRNRLQENYATADVTDLKTEASARMQPFKDRFMERMDDDFDTPGALAVLFDLVNECNKLLDSEEAPKPVILKSALDVLKEMISVFGLTFLKERQSAISDVEIERKIKLRAELKEKKKYKQADEIRQDLAAHGIILEDVKDGKTVWREKI